MSATVHYDARFAAEGGPAFTGPAIRPERFTEDEAAAPVAVLYDFISDRWVIADGQGNKFAEADNPAELVGWMTTYLSALGRTVSEQLV